MTYLFIILVVTFVTVIILKTEVLDNFFEEQVLLQRIDRTFNLSKLEELKEQVKKSNYPIDVMLRYIEIIENKMDDLKPTEETLKNLKTSGNMIIEDTPQEIFDEIKEASIQLWKENYSYEHGCLSEKLAVINNVRNYQDNVMTFYEMFDEINKLKLLRKLSGKSSGYIVRTYYLRINY